MPKYQNSEKHKHCDNLEGILCRRLADWPPVASGSYHMTCKKEFCVTMFTNTYLYLFNLWDKYKLIAVPAF